MAIQVLNPPRAAVGDALKGLSGALEQLAQSKIADLQRQYYPAAERARYAKGLEPLLGKEISDFVSNLNPEERKYALQNVGSLMQLSKMGQAAMGPQNGMQQLAQGAQAQQPEQGLGESSDQGKLIQDIFTSPQTKMQKETLGIKKAESERKAGKDVRDYLKPYEEKYTAGRSNLRDYNGLIELARSGDLTAGGTKILADKLGVGDMLLGYSQQVANKLIGRLALNSRGAFGPGARITNYLEKTFQRSLPSLWNTPEGIIGISEINKRSDIAENILPYQARQEIIAEHGGNIPNNIAQLVEKRIEPQVKNLEEESLRIVKRLAGEKSSRQTFAEKPNPAQFKGKTLLNEETGEEEESNGTEWVPKRK